MAELKFQINAFNQGTLPMFRLAEYMMKFTQLISSKKDRGEIYFERLEKGSLGVVSHFPSRFSATINRRCIDATNGMGDRHAISAWKQLELMLMQDKSSGSIFDEAGNIVVNFPYTEEITIGPILQKDTLTGMLIRVGGKRDMIPVHIVNKRTTFVCRAPHGMAQELAKCLFKRIHVHGRANWERSSIGKWVLRKFIIKEFEEIKECDLDSALDELCDLGGSNWSLVQDPIGELIMSRGHEED